MILQETLVYKLGILGMSEEVTISAPFTIDTDWDPGTVSRVIDEAMAKAVEESGEEFAKYFSSYVFQKYFGANQE